MRSLRRFVRVLPAIGMAMACGRDSASSPSAKLLQVVLAPGVASLVVGGSLQFGARGLTAEGQVVPATVGYEATGGTITPGGLYSAGAATGTFRVIATVEGGAPADTAVVTLTPVGVHDYTTAFPAAENPVSEGGRWISGGAAGLDWTNVSTASGLAIGHEVGPSYTDATAVLTGAWGGNQRASAAVYGVKANDACYQEVELRLRSAIAAHVNTGYEISYKVSTSTSAYLIIVRWNGALGDFTYLARQNGAQYGVGMGDVVSGSIVGNVITAYKNGVQLAQVADSTFAAGAPGMGFNLENGPAGCSGTNGDYGYTSFTATDAP